MKRSTTIPNRWQIVAWHLTLLLSLSGVAAALPIVGRTDTFGDGTTLGWGGGITGLPRHSAEGGPAGPGDGYLEISTRAFHLGTRHQGPAWTGDYLAAGIEAIEMDLRNLSGSTDLRIRVLLFGPGGTFATHSVALPALEGAAAWAHHTFSLRPTDLLYVAGGTADVTTTLRHVTTVLIRHDLVVPTPPGFNPPDITATLGLDNIEAVLGNLEGQLRFDARGTQAYVLTHVSSKDIRIGLLGTDNPTLTLELDKRYEVRVLDPAAHPFELIAQSAQASADTILLSMKPNEPGGLQEDPTVQWEERWEESGEGSVTFTLSQRLWEAMQGGEDQTPGYRCGNHSSSMRGRIRICTAPMLEDINRDCQIDFFDLAAVMAQWLTNHLEP